MSIRWRLTVWYALIVSLVVGLLGAFVYLALQRGVEQEHVAYDRRLAGTLAEAISEQGRRGAVRSEWAQGLDLGDEELVRQLRGHNAYLQLVDSRGRRSNKVAPPFRLDTVTTPRIAQCWVDRRHGRYMVVVNQPVVRAGTWVGSVQVFEDLSALDEFLERTSALMLLGMAVGVAIAIGGGGVMAFLAFRPIEGVVDAIAAIGPDDLTGRLNPGPVPSELRPLVTSFNGMLDRLEISFGRQRQFVADASHELRTPVSAILGHARLLDRWGKSDPKVLSESIDYIYRDARRMESLVENLLALARTDSPELPSPHPVDLGSLVAEVVAEARVLAARRALTAQGGNHVTVMANREAVRRVVSELVHNAIKFTPPRGHVVVEIGHEGAYGFVSVSDDGVGIRPEELPRVFERFYRVDKARSRASHGTGLGLPIAQSLAEAYGGRITVSSEPGQGSCFRVELPLASEAAAPAGCEVGAQ